MRVIAAVVVALVAVAACGGGDDSDEETLNALVAFAREPSDETWSQLPLTDDVELGLGHHLRQPRAARELRDPAAWQLEPPSFGGDTGPFFRGGVGPFSALDVIARSAELKYVDGSYPRCASPAAPPPPGLASLRRRSIQPSVIDSCPQWFAVDVFLTEESEIAAVTLDLWEP
jgi:hypothetical protein